MSALVFALALLYPSIAPDQPEEQLRLIAERYPSYRSTDEGFELGRSRGWLRLSRVYLDFQLTFDFKAATADTDAGVAIRVWTGKGGWPDRGYRLGLPTSPTSDVSSLLVAHREEVKVVQSGRIDLRPADEWQHVEITGDGREITLKLNGTVAGVYAIGEFGGHILFDNRKGRVQFRNISPTSIDNAQQWPENLLTPKQLEDAEGRLPTLAHEVNPNYTPEALRRPVQGMVVMEVVVLPDGSVGPVRVVRSLDRDLDLSALAAVKRWKFTPGIIKGNPVSVLVVVEMSFSLK